MSKVNIKGGTPVGSKSLCRSCTWSHIMTGYRESEMLVICTQVNPNVTVPFAIYECTNHNDKNRPTWEQMARLAIDVLPLSSAKTAGFRAHEKVQPEEVCTIAKNK